MARRVDHNDALLVEYDDAPPDPPIRLVAEDAAIGLVFPALFSLGVILISRYAGGVHLDTDVVLLGELAFAPFDRLIVAGRDLGQLLGRRIQGGRAGS